MCVVCLLDLDDIIIVKFSPKKKEIRWQNQFWLRIESNSSLEPANERIRFKWGKSLTYWKTQNRYSTRAHDRTSEVDSTHAQIFTKHRTSLTVLMLQTAWTTSPVLFLPLYHLDCAMFIIIFEGWRPDFACVGASSSSSEPIFSTLSMFACASLGKRKHKKIYLTVAPRKHRSQFVSWSEVLRTDISPSLPRLNERRSSCLVLCSS